MKVRLATLFLLISVASASPAADNRLADLSKLVLNGRPAEAQARLRDLAEEYRKQLEPHNEGLSLMILAIADVALGDIPAGRANLRTASARLASGGDYFTAWIALLWGAGVEIGQGNWEEAVQHHELTLTMLREAHESERPFSLESFRKMAPLFGVNVDLFIQIPLPPELMKRLLLKMAEAITRDSFGSVLIELGQLERAETELERASDLSAMFLGLFDGSIDAHFGELRRRQWRLEEAHRHYVKALTNVGVLPLPNLQLEPMELRVLGQLADIELLSGRLPEALAWNDRALQFVYERKQPSRELSLLEDRGLLLMQANRYTDALRVLDQAQAIAEPRDVCLKASILTDIGSLHMYRGHYGAASAEIEKAIEIFQTVNDPTSEGQAWTMLAKVYCAIGADDSIDHLVETARKLARKSRFAASEQLLAVVTAQRDLMTGKGSVEAVTRAYQALANTPAGRAALLTPEVVQLFSAFAQLRADPFAAAGPKFDPNAPGATAIPMASEMISLLQAFEQVRGGDAAAARQVWSSILEQTSSPDVRAACLAGIGMTYWDEGNRSEAIRWLGQAADVVDDGVANIGDDDLLARYLGSPRSAYFDLVIDKLAENGNVSDAFEYAERARARAFLQSVGNHRVEPRRGGSDRLVREAESLRIRISELERDGSIDPKELEHARGRYRTVLRRLKTTNPEYASLMQVEPRDIEGLRADVPPDTSLVSYFVMRGVVHTWILDRDSFDYIRRPLDDAALRRAVCWAAGLRSAGRGGEVSEACDERATAEEAYDLLIAPLRDKLRKPRLFIIPHGVLHQIPFAVLRDARTGRHLIEDFTLLFAPSASSLRFLRDKETPVEGGALVLGNPDGALGNLAGAQREAQVVARDLRTVAITGADATENLLYDLDGYIDLVHIGAHGDYNSTQPLFSRIALAPGGGHDGNLQVHEILNAVDLAGVNLVVLSACRTAVGERTGGDDVVGLTRAVLYAGSPGVISTLWNINDAAAVVLMEEFYCRLLGGASVADALREAQLLLLRSSLWRSPEHWGAFILTGDPQGRFTARGGQ